MAAQAVGRVLIRPATAADVRAVVELLVDDPLGAVREDLSDLGPYEAAYERIEASPEQLLVVAEQDGRVVGTMQLGLVPGLSRQGSTRMDVEAVRVHADLRGQGLGRDMMAWAVAEARRRGCAVVQLTSDKTRPDAHRFYERLGFTNSHEGFKLLL